MQARRHKGTKARRVDSPLRAIVPSSLRAPFGFTPSFGFTLVEMLVVLGIIVLVIATAIPVFNSLTGNHSLAAAQNQIASMLATARSDAIYNRQVTGVFFFIDP